MDKPTLPRSIPKASGLQPGNEGKVGEAERKAPAFRSGLERGLHKGRVLDLVNSFKIIECETCSFRHLVPIPTEEELHKFYKEEYYESARADYLKQDIANAKYLEILFETRLNTFEKLTAGRNILDVGCFSGEFIKYARDRRWKCTGIEPSESACNIARKKGLNVHHTTFDEFVKNQRQRFDAVHAKNILEHIPDPVKFIKTCHALLADKGILYLEVPNDYNLFQRLGVRFLKEKKGWLAIPDHINYFNFKSLKGLLAKNGFKIVKHDTTFPIYFLLLSGLNFIKSKPKGEKAHRIRVNFEMFFYNSKFRFLKHIIYQFLSHIGLGRTVIYYARKV